MQAQQVGQGYAAQPFRRTAAMFGLALGLLVALVLAGDFGYWLKSISLQSAPAQSVRIVHQQAPDAADRNAAVSAPALALPHEQSPDARERNQQLAQPVSHSGATPVP